jgi:hypothetical protein
MRLLRLFGLFFFSSSSMPHHLHNMQLPHHTQVVPLTSCAVLLCVMLSLLLHPHVSQVRALLGGAPGAAHRKKQPVPVSHALPHTDSLPNSQRLFILRCRWRFVHASHSHTYRLSKLLQAGAHVLKPTYPFFPPTNLALLRHVTLFVREKKMYCPLPPRARLIRLLCVSMPLAAPSPCVPACLCVGAAGPEKSTVDEDAPRPTLQQLFAPLLKEAIRPPSPGAASTAGACAGTFFSMCAFVWACVHMCAYVCVCTCVSVSVCVCVCACVRVRVYPLKFSPPCPSLSQCRGRRGCVSGCGGPTGSAVLARAGPDRPCRRAQARRDPVSAFNKCYVHSSLCCMHTYAHHMCSNTQDRLLTSKCCSVSRFFDGHERDASCVFVCRWSERLYLSSAEGVAVAAPNLHIAMWFTDTLVEVEGDGRQGCMHWSSSAASVHNCYCFHAGMHEVRDFVHWRSCDV